MTGYMRHWDCLICGERQISIDYPRPERCDACIRPLAAILCREALGMELDAEGVDKYYWMRKANSYASCLWSHKRTLDRRKATA